MGSLNGRFGIVKIFAVTHITRQLQRRHFHHTLPVTMILAVSDYRD
jgi:trehalose-6-phosphate synthase